MIAVVSVVAVPVITTTIDSGSHLEGLTDCLKGVGQGNGA